MYETLDIISQIGIAVFGAPAIFFLSLKSHKYRRVGFLCGLLSQPFWTYSVTYNEQYGIFLLVLLYWYSWINGLRNHWSEEP